MKETADQIDFPRILLGTGRFRAVWQGALLVVFAIGVFGVVVDIRNTAKSGQIDLRNRVVGARAMILGYNPYTYRWRPNDPTTLLDQKVLAAPIGFSRATASPAVLSLHALNANLPYQYQKFIWFFTQLAFFCGIAWFAILRAPDPVTKAAILLVAVLFSSTMFWRCHVDLGQAYVLFSCFAVLFISRLKAVGPRREAFSGVFLGILVCLRPQFAVLGLPLLIYRRPTLILGAFAGLLIGLLVPTLISSTVWSDYVRAMMHYAALTAPPLATGDLLAASAEMPVVVEGASNLAYYFPFWFKQSNLRAIFGHFDILPPLGLYTGLLMAGGVAWIFYIFRLKRTGVPLDFCTAKTLALVLFIELVMPIKRYCYYDVILVAIIVAIFSTGAGIRLIRNWEWALILGSWCCAVPLPTWVSADKESLAIAAIPPYAILLWAILTPHRSALSTASSGSLEQT